MNRSLRQKNKLLPEQETVRISLRMVILVLLMLTLTGTFYAYASVQALNTAYETSAALNIQQEMTETNRRLKLELSNLRSPYTLERRASAMGLIKPKPRQVRRIQ
ncbi:MAG: hypothetical protein LBJ14_09450 [Desulfarculales bacterium]|nr:hypothetical protein [Desulfarculales bacterium]